MLVGDEFAGSNNFIDRKNELATKIKDGSVTDLIPTLFDMTKAVMKIRCNLDKTSADDKMLEDFSKLESTIIEITSQIEYLKRMGH